MVGSTSSVWKASKAGPNGTISPIAFAGAPGRTLRPIRGRPIISTASRAVRASRASAPATTPNAPKARPARQHRDDPEAPAPDREVGEPGDHGEQDEPDHRADRGREGGLLGHQRPRRDQAAPQAGERGLLALGQHHRRAEEGPGEPQAHEQGGGEPERRERLAPLLGLDRLELDRGADGVGRGLGQVEVVLGLVDEVQEGAELGGGTRARRPRAAAAASSAPGRGCAGGPGHRRCARRSRSSRRSPPGPPGAAPSPRTPRPGAG